MDDVESSIRQDGIATIDGKYRLLSNSGHEFDNFRVRIVFPAEFPQRRCHPRVFLDCHRDQWIIGNADPDSHIEESGRMCMFVPLESGLDFEKENELVQLFPHIHTFLLKERVYQKEVQEARRTGMPKPRWPGPERAHDVEGLQQAIRASGQKLGRNDPCVCGSGKKFKRCCWNKLMRAKK